MAATAYLTVRVQPRVSRNEFAGWDGDTLRVRLHAAPVDGRANEALRRLLAKRLDIPPSDISIVTGETSRTKRLRIEGLTQEELRSRLDT